ncbi:MAG: transaldolase, partial [Anaerolineae bacterium]|nr:transaldolase [Anaerolineae bacterium]
MTNKAQQLKALGQSIWYDNIQRKLLLNGDLAGMVARGEIYGVTSNPSIFHNAITKSGDYDQALKPLAVSGKSSMEIYESLAIADIQAAADLFLPLYSESEGLDGYVSLEVNPNLAHDTEATSSEAQRLWDLVDRPNLMVKIPATSAGIPAIESSIAAGINVNVTLIFSQERYAEVMAAYLSGLEKRLADGNDLSRIASVASFFISRIDNKVDASLEKIGDESSQHAKIVKQLLGQVAVANAKLAYQRFKQVFEAARFTNLAAHGARFQRPLWASTSTKNPAYSDVKYVEELV